MLTWNEVVEPNNGPFANYQIIRRNGAVVPFESANAPVAVVMNALGLMLGKRQHLKTAGLVALSKLLRLPVKLQPGKAHGFFSASKANLRNAP